MFATPNGDVVTGGAVVGGLVILLHVIKPFILPKTNGHNGYAGKISALEGRASVLESRVEKAEEEILGLRKRCHELGNFISELQGRMSRTERR